MNIIKYGLLVVFLSSFGNLFSYTTYHTPKLYGVVGSGTMLLNGGLGVSYTAEITAKPEDDFFHAVTTDMLFLGILDPSAFEYNLLSTYGIGHTFKSGHKLIVDIFGIGLSLRSGGYKTTGQSIAYIPPAGFVFNFPGFQFIHKNQLYLAWRNNFTIGDFTEFKSYISIGYDFGKLFVI